MFIELLIILWVTTGIFTAIWQTGRVHGYHIVKYSDINNPPYIAEAVAAIFVWPATVFATSITYGKVPGYKWTWPKKGVTYQ
jgi:hypothetical protein